MSAVDLFQCTHAYIGDNLRDLRASSGLTECHVQCFGDRQAGQDFGLILYYLCDAEKWLNLESPSPFLKTSKNACNRTL